MIIQVGQDNEKHSGSVQAGCENTGLVQTSKNQSSIVQAGHTSSIGVVVTCIGHTTSTMCSRAKVLTIVPVWLSFVINPVPIQSECFLSIQKTQQACSVIRRFC